MKPFKQFTQILTAAIFFLGALPGYSQRTRPPNAPDPHGPAQPGTPPQAPKPPNVPNGPPPSPRPPQGPGPARPPRAPRPPRSPYAPLPLRLGWNLWQPRFAGSPRSAFLGSVSIGQRGDRDILWLPSSTPAFSAIQLQVEGGPVEIRQLLVRYADGTSEILPVRYLASSRRSTPPIGLSDPWRGVQSIEIWSGDFYGPQPHVTAYGLW